MIQVVGVTDLDAVYYAGVLIDWDSGMSIRTLISILQDCHVDIEFVDMYDTPADEAICELGAFPSEFAILETFNEKK